MKVLIWFLCLFANALITTFIRESGIILGGLPTAVLIGATIWLARTLCEKWDEHKDTKEVMKKIIEGTQSNTIEESSQTPSDIKENNAVPAKKAQWASRYECLDIAVSKNHSHGMCVVCKRSERDLKQCSIKTEIGTRNLNICDECIVEFQKATQKQG